MDKEMLYRKLETALRKTLCSRHPTNASTYVFDDSCDMFVRGNAEREFVAVHRKEEIEHIECPCGVIKPGQFGTVMVSICPLDDVGPEFMIKNDRIVRVDMYGDAYKNAIWIERFVSAFSKIMGGPDRLED